MKKLLVLLLVLSSCSKEGSSVAVSGARDSFDVVFLFKKDNCSVYRFSDNGRSHYFTDCTETISTRTESCGKNCTKRVDENIGGY